ncbi:MAG: CatB-related O-acetyltransferase, partial [Nakamurella sp.]
FTSIASGVRFILGGNHPVDRLTTFPLRIKMGLPLAGQDGYPYSSGDIDIGSDVWIATGVTVLSGVRIGHGAVVAAGSIVSRDVEPFSIVAGIPAKLVRKRFADDVIASMLEIAWWDWPLDKVVEAAPLLSERDVTAFVRTYS